MLELAAGPGETGFLIDESDEMLLREAGFDDVLSQEVHGVMRFNSTDDYWPFQSVLAAPVRAAVASMDADEVAAVRATVEEMLMPFRSDGAFQLSTMLVTATAC